MFVAHLPAGYLAATAALRRAAPEPRLRRRLLGVALAASVAPDLDLAYFYASGRQEHHHALFPHWPSVWIALTLVGLAVAAARKSRPLALASLFAGGGGLLHLVLDSIAGSVRWGAPWSAAETTLVVVPPHTGWWISSMVLHWTFAVELAIVAAAALVWWRRRSPRR